MRRADARIHHDRQAAGFRARGGVFVDDAGLQPQRLRADRHRFVGNRRRVLGAAEDVDDVDPFRARRSSDGYARSPSTSVSRGLTGITR